MVAAFPHIAVRERSTTAPAHPLRFLACTLALAGSFVGYWLLNYSAFPLFDPVYFWRAKPAPSWAASRSPRSPSRRTGIPACSPAEGSSRQPCPR